MSRFIESKTWRGGVGTGDELDLEPTGYRSPRKEPKRKQKQDHIGLDRIKTFNEARGFGFTVDGVFFHKRDIVEGEPVSGAPVVYSVKETEKRLRAVNVQVIGGEPH